MIPGDICFRFVLQILRFSEQCSNDGHYDACPLSDRGFNYAEAEHHGALHSLAEEAY